MVALLTGNGPKAMGGAELQLDLLGRELRRRGWQVSFLVGDYGQERVQETPDGIRLLRAYANSAGGRSMASTVGAMREFWKALKDVDASIYVTRGLTGQAGIVAAYSRVRRKKYVFWFGKNSDARYGVPWLSGLPLTERLPASYGIRAASAVVCQTEQQRELLRKHIGRDGVLIRNATPWCEGTSIRESGGYALWVGSVQPKKRPDMMLDLAAEMPDVRFVMAGGSIKGHTELYHTTEQRAAELPNVDFLGFVPFAEIQKHFRSADLLISTSDGRDEGFPNVFLQAWSIGVPVVATCDPDGVISRHNLGFHCKSIAEMRGAIGRLREDRLLRHEIGKRAREYVRENHSLERVGNRLETLLKGLLGDGSPHRDDEQDRRAHA